MAHFGRTLGLKKVLGLIHSRICNVISIEVGRAVTRLFLDREVWCSNLGLVKSDSVLPMARHRYDISLDEDVLPWRNHAEIGHPNSLHSSV